MQLWDQLWLQFEVTPAALRRSGKRKKQSGKIFVWQIIKQVTDSHMKLVGAHTAAAVNVHLLVEEPPLWAAPASTRQYWG